MLQQQRERDRKRAKSLRENSPEYYTKHKIRVDARKREMSNRMFPGDADAVAAIYLMRDRMNDANPDVRYVVDHIVPLYGENVSGLHVSWNMRVATFDENAAKSNRWDESFLRDAPIG